jgi:hypothetical protein
MSGIEVAAVVVGVFLIIGITAGIILVAVPLRSRRQDNTGLDGRWPEPPMAGKDGKPPRWPDR